MFVQNIQQMEEIKYIYSFIHSFMLVKYSTTNLIPDSMLRNLGMEKVALPVVNISKC